MLTDAEIASMQETCEAAFPDSVTVQRLTWTADGIGGRSVSATATSSLTCRVAEPTGRDRLRAEALQLVIERRLDFPFDGDLLQGDRVVWSGKTYEVVFVSKDRSWCLTGIAYLGNAT